MSYGVIEAFVSKKKPAFF